MGPGRVVSWLPCQPNGQACGFEPQSEHRQAGGGPGPTRPAPLEGDGGGGGGASSLKPLGHCITPASARRFSDLVRKRAGVTRDQVLSFSSLNSQVKAICLQLQLAGPQIILHFLHFYTVIHRHKVKFKMFKMKNSRCPSPLLQKRLILSSHGFSVLCI